MVESTCIKKMMSKTSIYSLKECMLGGCLFNDLCVYLQGINVAISFSGDAISFFRISRAKLVCNVNLKTVKGQEDVKM